MKTFKQFLIENKNYEVQIFWDDPDDEGEFNDFFNVKADSEKEAINLAKKEFRKEHGHRVKFLKADIELTEEIANTTAGIAIPELPLGKKVARRKKLDDVDI